VDSRRIRESLADPRHEQPVELALWLGGALTNLEPNRGPCERRSGRAERVLSQIAELAEPGGEREVAHSASE
jgi:hypothetical protein